MLFPYLKMQGAGNQIVVVDQREKNAPPPSADGIRRLGDPASGPGFDQLMWVGPPASDTAAASYRVFNRDGSEVEQCGNGVRCVARMLARSAAPLRSFILDSPAGLIEATVLDDDQVSVSMGPPEFEPAKVPFVADERADQYDLDVRGAFSSGRGVVHGESALCPLGRQHRCSRRGQAGHGHRGTHAIPRSDECGLHEH